MQRLGYNWSTKKQRTEIFANILGDSLAGFASKGLTGIPGFPLDASGRMSLGHLIPGSGLVTKKADHTRDAVDAVGPVADLAKRGFESANKLLQGEVGSAAAGMMPTALQNIGKAYDMLRTGQYKDGNGNKVLDVTPFEAVLKGIGFQPQTVKRVQDAGHDVQVELSLRTMRQHEITQTLAQGYIDDDQDKKDEARAMVERWNRNNPEAPVKYDVRAALKQARTAREDKATRLEKATPKGMRAEVKRQMAEAQ
jgi:hypothetical protein